MTLDQLENRVSVHVARHHYSSAHEENRQDVYPGSPDPKKGGKGNRDIVAAEIGASQEIGDVRQNLPMSEHHGFRPSCSARGVRQEAQVGRTYRLVDVVVGRFGN
jgi:hypothetical protein